MAQSGTKVAATRVTRKGATIHKTNERPGTRAQVRYVRVSAYKAREVLDLIRGKHVIDADEILQLVERDVAIPVRKLLNSAIANAQNNDSQDPDTLFVSACYADEGPTLKRWRPRSRGRASRIRKRTCHITIIVARLPEAELARRAERDAQAAPASGGRRRTARQAASRRARVARSRQAEGHDHDHEDEVESGEPTETMVEDAGTVDDAIEAQNEAEPTDEAVEVGEPTEATVEEAEADETEEPSGTVDDAIEAETSPENSAAPPTDEAEEAEGDESAEDEKKDED